MAEPAPAKSNPAASDPAKEQPKDELKPTEDAAARRFDRELESDQDQIREEVQESERNEFRNLNQGMQTGTDDAPTPSINWGPDYSLPRKRHPEVEKKDEPKKTSE